MSGQLAVVVGNPKPVLVELGATCPTRGLLLLETEYASGDVLDACVERAGPQVLAAMAGGRAGAGLGPGLELELGPRDWPVTLVRRFWSGEALGGDHGWPGASWAVITERLSWRRRKGSGIQRRKRVPGLGYRQLGGFSRRADPDGSCLMMIAKTLPQVAR